MAEIKSRCVPATADLLQRIGVSDRESYYSWSKQKGHPDKGGDSAIFQSVECWYTTIFKPSQLNLPPKAKPTKVNKEPKNSTTYDIFNKMLSSILTPEQIRIISVLVYTDGTSFYADKAQAQTLIPELVFLFKTDNFEFKENIPFKFKDTKFTFQNKIDFLNTCKNYNDVLFRSPLLSIEKYLNNVEKTTILKPPKGVSGVIYCRKCKRATDAIVIVAQMRSSDEPATVTKKCVVCNTVSRD